MSEHSTTTMRSRRRREGRSSPTHRELHSIDNACNFERSPLYGLPQEAERTPQSSRNHGRWPDQPAGIACRATCNQPTSHHPGLQGKTRASQREASREASQREAPSTPSPGAAHTEALLGGPTAQPVSTTGRLKPAPCATEYKGSLPYHADVSSRKTVVSGQTQSPSDVRQPIRHNEKATQSFYDPEVEGCENHPGTCNPSADASHRKTTRAKRNGPRDTTFVNQRPPRPQRHTQTTDEPYLPRRYRHQADSRPRPPPSQSGAKTSFIKHESDLRPGVRRVKKRSPSEVNVSPDTSKPQRRPRTRQRSARPVYDPATSNAPHAGHFHNPQGQRKRSEPTIRVPASQLQLRVQEGHALGSDLRQPPEFLQPPDGPSRRACKRRRARERRREQLCTADIQERDRQTHVTHTQLLGYTRERMLQLDPTLTAAPDLNASQLNATAYARSLRPHCRDVPIQGVSAMGPTPPTGSSGWRKPENNHYSWFRNQHTDGMGTALSGSSYVLSQGNPYQPVLPVRGGRPLACHGSTGNPISHPTVLSGNPSVLSGSSGTGNVGRGNTPMHRDASPLANPTPIAIAESAIRRESSRTNDGGKEIIPANVTSYASTVLSQPLKQKQPCRELEHVGSLSWNIGPNSDTQPSKDTEYVNATTGANISDRRRKQTVQSAVKKPGTKPNTGGEGSNTVAPASNQENTKQPAQKPNPGTNGDTASVPATNHDNAKQTAQVEELKTGSDDDDGVTPVEPNATQQQPPQASGDEGASASSSSADDENDDGKSNPSNHDDNNNSNPFDDDDDDVQELKPTKEELEDALKPIYGDPAIAGFAMSVGENNLFQLGSKLERRCRSNLALAKRDLNKAIAQKSDIPRKVSDRLNKLAKTLTDLDTDVKLMSTALEKNAKDVKDLADELTYIRRYFMTKVQDIHFGLNWDIPTGNTPPASEHGEMPHQGSQPAINSQAQSAAPSRRYSFEVADGNQQHQQQQQLQQQIPIEEVRDGGITAPVTNATDNPNANSVLDIVDDGHGNNFNMNIDPTTGLLLFNGGNPTSATAQLPPTQQQSAGQDRTQQQQPQPPSIQVRRPQGYKPPEAVNAMTISDWRGGFDGKPDEDFSLFIEKFELHCNANSTDKDKWATLLRLRLSGLAQSIISGLTDEDKDNYGKLKATLTKTFGREDQYLTARDKIRKLQYATSFNDLLATLSSLMPKAYPMENQDFRNGTMYGVLMEKLPPDLIIELKRKGCETLNDLIRMAPKTEALIKDIRSMNPKYQVQPVQRVNATFITEEQTNVGMVGTDLAVRDAPRPSSRDQPPPQRYKANRRTTTQPQQQSRRPATQPYYGQSGRNIRPDYQGNRPQYQQATRGNPNLICGHCGKTGHCTLDCRARLREKEQERNRDQNRNNRGNQRNPPQRYNTFQQPWRQQRRQDLPIYCNKCNQPGHVAVGCRNNIHYTQPQIDIMSDTRSGVDYATHQMQQLQLAQPQYRPIQYQQQQPHHTAVAMTTQAMDMPHRSASAPMTYQQPQQPIQPAQQQQVAIPLQQSTTQQPQNPNPLNAIQQATGNQQPLGTPEDKVTRSYTDEDFRKMEEKLDLMVSKVYQKQDQEKPSTDILATLTRHENGTQPQYVPVDHRLAIIPAIVQGYSCNALFDTGSSITVAPIAMAEILKIQLEDSDKSITAVTGHTAEVTKKGQVRLTIAGQTRDVEMFFTGNFLGTKNPYDFIIGVDVMRSFPDATISVSNRKLTIGTKTICWKTKAESMQEGRKVFLLQKANIPPHTTTRVGALIDKSRGDVTQSVTIEQAGKHPATVTPTVSMVDSDNRCEVMLHNPTNAPLIIRPYTVVAEALNIIVGDDGILSNYPEITAGAALSFSKRHATDPTYVVDYSHCDCNDAQKAQLKELLDRYADQFSKNGYDLSIAKVNPMQIRTTTEEPPRPTIYSTNRALRPHVHEALENMREMGCIRESNTPWLSPLVMVKKKTGDLRPCIDLRKLNRITIPDYFPLPKVTDAIDRIAGCNFFTGLDLSKGFWQIPLSDDASWKCGIISENKVYQCIAMPFGLCNAPSAFMRAMDTILGPLKETTVVYIDDVVIMTKPDSFDQHLVDIEEVLKRFKQYNIKINPKKCEFVRKEITFLGHTITRDGVKPDERNTIKISNLPIPKSQTDVRHCLGVFSFFRRLIRNFAKIASPLTSLCGKGTKFVWTDECQSAFDQLKTELSSSPVIYFPDDEKEFHIFVDASQKAIGIALCQCKAGDDKNPVYYPICFYSRALSATEQKRPAVQLELMAIVEALRLTKYYTYGRKTIIHTDHKPLIHLMAKGATHAHLARWIIELQEYDTVIYHIKGTQNTLADALSRLEGLHEDCSDQELEEVLNGPFGLDTDGNDRCNAIWSLTSNQTLDQHQREDPILSEAIKAIENKVDPATIHDPEIRWYATRCELDETGTLVLKQDYQPSSTNATKQRLIVPKVFRKDLFKQFHSSLIGGGHVDSRKTCEKMNDYFWRGMTRDVSEWHKRCFECQIRATKKHKIPLVMTVLRKPFQKMGLDICGPLHLTAKGNLYYLLVIDWFTKYIVVIPLTDCQSITVIRALWDHVILKYGVPEEIVTDNAKTFTSNIFTEFLAKLGIRKEHCTPHHSDGNAITERPFRTYHDMIAKYRSNQDPNSEFMEWDELLHIANFAYNVTPHKTTGESPFMLMHGRDPMFPTHLILHTRKSQKEPLSIRQFRAELVKTIETLHDKAAESFEEAANRTKLQADKLCKHSNIREGELVLFRDYSLRVGISSKYKNPWRDIYRVRRIDEQHAYIVPSTNPNEPLKRVHLNQIKRFFVDEEEEVLLQPNQNITNEENQASPPTQPSYKERKRARILAAPIPNSGKQRRRGEGTKYNLRQFNNEQQGDGCDAAVAQNP